LANVVVAQELSVRNLERMLSEQANPQAARTVASQSVHVLDLERSIARQIGMKVQVKSSAGKGRGRLVIHYATLDQFDELLRKLGVTVE
jgi:ParB family chromosome partitioning protein